MANLSLLVDNLPDSKDIVFLRLQGTLESSTLKYLSEKLEQLTKEGYTRVIIDMHGITLVNSSGIGGLVDATRILESLGGKLVLLNLSQRVSNVINLLNLATFFQIFSEEKDALDYLQKCSELSPRSDKSSLMPVANPEIPPVLAPGKQSVQKNSLDDYQILESLGESGYTQNYKAYDKKCSVTHDVEQNFL